MSEYILKELKPNKNYKPAATSPAHCPFNGGICEQVCPLLINVNQNYLKKEFQICAITAIADSLNTIAEELDGIRPY